MWFYNCCYLFAATKKYMFLDGEPDCRVMFSIKWRRPGAGLREMAEIRGQWRQWERMGPDPLSGGDFIYVSGKGEVSSTWPSQYILDLGGCHIAS